MTKINGHDINDRHLGIYLPGRGNSEWVDLPNAINFLDRASSILKKIGFKIRSGINIDTGDDEWFWAIGEADFRVTNGEWSVFTHGYVANSEVEIHWQSLIYSDDPTIEQTIIAAIDNTIERFWLTELLVEAARAMTVKVPIEYLRKHYQIGHILTAADFESSICRLINKELKITIANTQAVQIDWGSIAIYTPSFKDRPALELSADRALVLLYELRIAPDVQLEDLDNWVGITNRSVSQTIGFPFQGRI